MSKNEPWYMLKNPEKVPSPALLIYPERVRSNIELMIRIAGDVKRLRPHVKTHKLPELIALQVSFGIKKFKCATIAEAEMTAQNGGEDILLAYQPVGPHIKRLFKLKKAYPWKKFSTLVDNPGTSARLSREAEKNGTTIDLFIDIDNGMHRTGISADASAVSLIKEILSSSKLKFAGLHVYDGHIVKSDPGMREKECLQDFEPVLQLIRDLKSQGIEVPTLIAGGTPTFPVHARFKGRELSPGTTVLWDMSYSSQYSDLEFLHAALLLGRVVSKPQNTGICLDLGYKAVSADKPHPRVYFKDIGDYKVLNQSEEHLVIQSPEVQSLEVGDILYGIPMHICPTAALYSDVYAVRNREFTELWKVAARDRTLTV